MSLNEAIETLNHIVRENPDKKTGLYTACDVVATHICKNATIDKEIKLDEVFKDIKIVDVHSITKGKGYQGAVKRFGVTIKLSKIIYLKEACEILKVHPNTLR